MLLKNPKVYNPVFEKPKKKFSKNYLYIFLVFIFFDGIIYFVFYSSFFQIKNIIIPDSVNPGIVEILQNLNNRNIISLNISNVEAEISEKFPEVKGLTITRGLPSTLKIAFQEREPRLVWQSGGRSFLVDSSGAIYKETDVAINLPIVKDNNNIPVQNGKTVASENFINFVIELSTNFNQTTGFKITQFEVNETIFQVEVLTDQGWKVIFDTTRKASEQLADLMTFLKDHKSEVTQYIDLRVEGRVYFK